MNKIMDTWNLMIIIVIINNPAWIMLAPFCCYDND